MLLIIAFKFRTSQNGFHDGGSVLFKNGFPGGGSLVSLLMVSTTVPNAPLPIPPTMWYFDKSRVTTPIRLISLFVFILLHKSCFCKNRMEFLREIGFSITWWFGDICMCCATGAKTMLGLYYRWDPITTRLLGLDLFRVPLDLRPWPLPRQRFLLISPHLPEDKPYSHFLFDFLSNNKQNFTGCWILWH